MREGTPTNPASAVTRTSRRWTVNSVLMGRWTWTGTKAVAAATRDITRRERMIEASRMNREDIGDFGFVVE